MITQAAWPHQVAVVAVGGGRGGGRRGCLPGTTGGAIPGLSAMIGAGAGAAEPRRGGGLRGGAFLSGTANSTSARAADTAPATSRVTHTIDERFMTSSFRDVGQLTELYRILGRKAWNPVRVRVQSAVSHFFTCVQAACRLTSAHASINSKPRH